MNGHPNQDDDGAGESERVTNVLPPVRKRFPKFLTKHFGLGLFTWEGVIN